MAKLILLALAFTALLAFASAHKTIVTTTTIEDENPVRRQQQCSQIEEQSFNMCDKYFQSKSERSDPFENRGQKEQGQGQQGLRQMCCQELQNVDEQCQCQAVKKVLRDATMTQQQQRGSFSSQMVERLKQKAEKLISRCNLKISSQECQVGTITTTTMITEENPRGSQQCRQMIPQRFNQCQRFVEQALQSGFPKIMMSTNMHGKQQDLQQLQKSQQQCCNELENVQEECHCEALQKVYEQAIEQQQQQQGQRQQGSRRGGQMQMHQVQQVVQILKNQCNLEAQQCKIPSEMF